MDIIRVKEKTLDVREMLSSCALVILCHVWRQKTSPEGEKSHQVGEGKLRVHALYLRQAAPWHRQFLFQRSICIFLVYILEDVLYRSNVLRDSWASRRAPQ